MQMTEILARETTELVVEQFQPESFAPQAVAALNEADTYHQFADAMFGALSPHAFNEWIKQTKSFAAGYGHDVGQAAAGYIDRNQLLSRGTLSIFREASALLIEHADDQAVARFVHGSAKRAIIASGAVDPSLSYKLRKRLY